MTQIKGIGDEAPDGWVLESYEAPMPKGLTNIITAIKEILQQGKIHTIHLELGRPIVYTRFIKEGEAIKKQELAKVGDISLGALARNIMMEEYTGGKLQGSPQEIFFDMLLALEARHVHLTHIGLGPETRFFEWMGLDPIAYGGITHLAGAELVRDGEIPNDSMIFFAGPLRGARADQSTYAMRGHMLLQEDLHPEETDG